MTKLTLITITCAALLLGAGPVLADSWTPPPDTIVGVEGSAKDGFGIFYYDGSSIFPPTDSESRAECEEYSRRVEIVRCKTAMRVWYRDLGALKRALRFAHLSTG